MTRVLVGFVALVVGLLAASCKKGGPEITCKVNGVCFVCPDAKERASCVRDPAASRCKWAEPAHCK
jgi:hypothetical protein